MLFTFSTAFSTPLPPYLVPPSLNSNASLLPVLAPLGTIALSFVPSLKVTVALTVKSLCNHLIFFLENCNII